MSMGARGGEPGGVSMLARGIDAGGEVAMDADGDVDAEYGGGGVGMRARSLARRVSGRVDDGCMVGMDGWGRSNEANTDRERTALVVNEEKLGSLYISQ